VTSAGQRSIPAERRKDAEDDYTATGAKLLLLPDCASPAPLCVGAGGGTAAGASDEPIWLDCAALAGVASSSL
jgi:hypothetical protein